MVFVKGKQGSNVFKYGYSNSCVEECGNVKGIVAEK